MALPDLQLRQGFGHMRLGLADTIEGRPQLHKIPQFITLNVSHILACGLRAQTLQLICPMLTGKVVGQLAPSCKMYGYLGSQRERGPHRAHHC